MSTKLYADNQCVEEIFSANELREIAGCDKASTKDKKKICNCPNCGAPVNGYICEYCGTEFDKPKKELLDEEWRESFAELVRKQRQAELQASQEWQTQNLLNTLNRYNANNQIMNIQDSINSAMTYQTCSLHDQMYNASILTNVYPTGRIEHIPIRKDEIEHHQISKDESIDDTPVSEADEELITALKWFMIGMFLFTLFAIGVTAIYNL